MPEPTLDSLLADFPEPVADLTRRARDVIRGLRPDAIERVWPGWKNVGYATGPAMSDVICVLSPAKGWVRLSFMRGDVPDPDGLLGEPGAKGAGHVRLRSVEELERPAVRAMLAAAFASRAPDAGPRPARTPKSPSAGGYQVGASRTLNVPVAALFAAWADERAREAWLPEPLTVRKATAPKSMRITWADGSSVDVMFMAKGDARSVVTVDHRKLADEAAVDRAREVWKERLDALRTRLEG